MSQYNHLYQGKKMEKGNNAEELVFKWLNETNKEVRDLRDHKYFQYLDVDFEATTHDGIHKFIEVKSDEHIKEEANFFVECFRINHDSTNNWFKTGWTWKSPAHEFIVHNPITVQTFSFNVVKLRKMTAKFVGENQSTIRVITIQTDTSKTTFGMLVPLEKLIGSYKIIKLIK